MQVTLGLSVSFVRGGLKEVLVLGARPEDGFGRDDPERDTLATAGVLFFGEDQRHIGIRGVQGSHMLGVAPPCALDENLVRRPMI
jgi:hypothetical protein